MVNTNANKTWREMHQHRRLTTMTDRKQCSRVDLLTGFNSSPQIPASNPVSYLIGFSTLQCKTSLNFTIDDDEYCSIMSTHCQLQSFSLPIR